MHNDTQLLKLFLPPALAQVKVCQQLAVRRCNRSQHIYSTRPDRHSQMTTDMQQRTASQYRLPLFGYIVMSVVCLTACRILLGDTMAMLNLAMTGHAAHANAPTEAITRTSPLYWITGNGAWVSRWECTNHDLWLAVVSIAANLWMGWEYWRYANSCTAAVYQLQDSIAKTHSLQLRRVFIQCVLIHAVLGVLFWWLPSYWILAALTLVNAKQARRLNATKIQVLRSQEAIHTETCDREILQALNNPQIAAQDRLDYARNLLMRRVPYADS